MAGKVAEETKKDEVKVDPATGTISEDAGLYTATFLIANPLGSILFLFFFFVCLFVCASLLPSRSLFC